jgi:hypothetical protein
MSIKKLFKKLKNTLKPKNIFKRKKTNTDKTLCEDLWNDFSDKLNEENTWEPIELNQNNEDIENQDDKELIEESQEEDKEQYNEEQDEQTQEQDESKDKSTVFFNYLNYVQYIEENYYEFYTKYCQIFKFLNAHVRSYSNLKKDYYHYYDKFEELKKHRCEGYENDFEIWINKLVKHSHEELDIMYIYTLEDILETGNILQ